MKTKAEVEADMLKLSETFLLASLALEDDDINDLDLSYSEEYDDFDDNLEEQSASEVLELSGMEWMLLARVICGDASRGTYNQIEKSKDYFAIALRAPDRWFRQMFRMGRKMFDLLVSRLSHDPIFQSRGRKPQRPIEYQLGCFLVRYSVRGCDTLQAARQISLGHGTVFLYCQRVSKAIRRLRKFYISFPGPERQHQIADDIEDKFGFPGCIGLGDGSLVRFTEEPGKDGHTYFSRKKCYSTNIQATVDHERRFTSYEIGWPGSVPDVKMFKASYIWQNRRALFLDGFYILADKGYPSSPYVVRPFDETEISKATPANKVRMRQFNKRLSSIRIEIEHAFGMLKGRFPSLKEFGLHDDMDEVYKAIEALLIIHNMCIDHGDHPQDIWNFDSRDDMQDMEDDDLHDPDEDPLPLPEFVGIPAYETEAWLKEAGKVKRIDILNMLFPL